MRKRAWLVALVVAALSVAGCSSLRTAPSAEAKAALAPVVAQGVQERTSPLPEPFTASRTYSACLRT